MQRRAKSANTRANTHTHTQKTPRCCFTRFLLYDAFDAHGNNGTEEVS